MHEVHELLVHERGPGNEADRLVRAAELDQPGDRVQLVRELMRLRAQRVREATNAVELTQDPFELGPVAERDHRADRLAPNHRRHPVRNEDAIPREQHLVAPTAITR